MNARKMLLGGILLALFSYSHSVDDSAVPRGKEGKLAELRSAYNIFKSINPNSANLKSLRELIKQVPRYGKLEFNENEFSYNPETGEIFYEPACLEEYVIELSTTKTDKKLVNPIISKLKARGWGARAFRTYHKEKNFSVYSILISTSSVLAKEEILTLACKDYPAVIKSIETRKTYDEKTLIKQKMNSLIKAMAEKDFQKQAGFYGNEIINWENGETQKVDKNLLSRLNVLNSGCNAEAEFQYAVVYGADGITPLSIHAEKNDYLAKMIFSGKSKLNDLDCIVRKIDNEWKIIAVFEESKKEDKALSAFGN